MPNSLSSITSSHSSYYEVGFHLGHVTRLTNLTTSVNAKHVADVAIPVNRSHGLSSVLLLVSGVNLGSYQMGRW
jgi:hypothetical protein